MEIKRKFMDSFTWCILTIVLGLYSVTAFTPIIEFKFFSLIVTYAILIIFACQRKHIKDITSLDIVIVGYAFFNLGILR